MVLEFEFRAVSFLPLGSTPGTMPQPFIYLVIFQVASCIFTWASLWTLILQIFTFQEAGIEGIHQQAWPRYCKMVQVIQNVWGVKNITYHGHMTHEWQRKDKNSEHLTLLNHTLILFSFQIS
jgi:hypothetical protein